MGSEILIGDNSRCMPLRYFTASRPSPAHPDSNEDVFFVDPERGLAGVFDGVGGIAGGGEAARLASRCIQETLISNENLKRAFERCHAYLREQGEKRYGHQIATTGVVVVLEVGRLTVRWGSAGDSRLYHYHAGSLAQISSDDSLISQALDSGWITRERAEAIQEATGLEELNPIERNLFGARNIVTQSLGIGRVIPHVGTFDAAHGDLLVLTSDGVHDNLTNAEIAAILRKGEGDPAAAIVHAARVVSQGASLRAKPDDLTAVVLELG